MAADLAPFAAWLAALVGLCVGSFLNVVIHRLPRMMEHDWHAQCADLNGLPAPTEAPLSLAKPRSRCPTCGVAIAACDNIPLLSFIFLGGKCRSCKTPVSLRYPSVELLTAALSAYAIQHFGPTPAGLGAMFLIWGLIALTFIDADTQLLPDSITLPLLWLGLAFNLTSSFVSLPEAVIGAMAGYLVLWIIFWLFKLATGKEGMGYGDFKLLAALGAWLGWKMLPAIILLSSVVGAVVGIALIALARHGRQVPIPFGPYLAAAGVIALFWGKLLTETYLGML